jgi:glucose/arabinose dehydrogenase
MVLRRPAAQGEQALRIRRFGWLLAVALVAALVATPLSSTTTRAATIRAQPVATNLRVPVTFAFAPNGRIFYGELNTGQIHIYDPRTRANTLFFTIPNIFARSESGLLGVALDPRYPAAPYVYAYATQLLNGSIWTRLLRLTDRGGKGQSPRTLLLADAHTTYPQHKGGRIEFGPDGMLYLYIGYQKNPANAQSLNNVFGKILRMTPTGGVPAGNPFRGSRVWAYGFRNSLGMAFDPWTRRLWLSEGGPACNDELNLVVRGRNYGWGPRSFASGTPCKTPPPPPRNTNQDGPSPVMPRLWWAQALTPTGVAFCRGCGLGRGYEGRLFLGNWKYKSNPLIPGTIRAITLNSTRDGVTSQVNVFTSKKVVLSVERGPAGALYFSDENAIYKLVVG